jgi:hypothetical protein
MKTYHSFVLIFAFVIVSEGCSQVSLQPEPTLIPTDSSLNESCAFIDSGQRGDGDLDAVVANGVEGEIGSAVWLNEGFGTFVIKEQELGFGMGLELGDLDDDGDLDIFIVAWDEPGRIWWNDGGGGFTDSAQILGEAGGFDVALGDLDFDGDLDAVIAHERDNTVWLNNGSGYFEDSNQRLGSAYTAAAGLADLDGDGDLDLITAGWDEPGKVWINNGEGLFFDSGQVLSPSQMHMHGLVVGDLTADGAIDVLIAGSSNQIWFNDGSAVFNQSEYRVVSGPGDTAALGDLDSDDDLDVYLAVGISGRAEDMILINDGAGGFTECENSLSTGFSSGIGLGDLDGDGDLDAFIAHGQLGLSSGGGLPNEVWWNETP